MTSLERLNDGATAFARYVQRRQTLHRETYLDARAHRDLYMTVVRNDFRARIEAREARQDAAITDELAGF